MLSELDINLTGKVWSNIAIPHFATAMIAFGIQKLLDVLNLGQYGTAS